MRALALLGVGASLLVGCTGPTELSNADVAATKAELSKEAYEKAMQAQGKGAELEQMRKADAEQGERGR